MTEPISRRSLITTSGATLAGAALAPFLPGSALAQQDSYTLWPDWQINWRVHKLSSKVKVEQISGGIRASTSTLLDDIKYQVALWSKERVSGDWTIKFGYKVISRLSASGGTFCCFYFNGVGEGSTRYPTKSLIPS